MSGDFEGLVGLVPEAWWQRLREEASQDPVWASHATRASLSPLPPLAVYFYSAAGCWLLASELSAKTSLPLGVELNPWGRALHVFVVDKDDAIDAFGRTALSIVREVEAVGGRVEIGVELEAMLATLDERAWAAASAKVVREMLASDEYRQCARVAALRVARATNLGGLRL